MITFLKDEMRYMQKQQSTKTAAQRHLKRAMEGDPSLAATQAANFIKVLKEDLHVQNPLILLEVEKKGVSPTSLEEFQPTLDEVQNLIEKFILPEDEEAE